MTDRSRTGTPTYVAAFEAFHEGWLARQEHYLDELLSAQQDREESRDEYLKDLVARVLSHYEEYYEEKSRMARQDVFLVFSPTWLTSLERAFLWISCFKPGMSLRLVADFVHDLSEEQRQRMARLIEETRIEERMLNDDVARIQESLGSAPLLERARRRGRLTEDGEIIQEDEKAMINTLRSEMETVVAAADLLRITTALKVVETLNPMQNVKFLTAAMQLHKRIRTCGLQRDGGT